MFGKIKNQNTELNDAKQIVRDTSGKEDRFCSECYLILDNHETGFPRCHSDKYNHI